MIKNDEYNQSVDVWSVGVLAYELCSGYAPFHAKDSKNTYAKISQVDYKLFSFFSPELKDFIRKLLRFNPEDRMTLHEALNHPFITNHLKYKDSTMQM